MSKIVFDSFCDKDTFDIAYRLANILKKRSGPVVICLDGDLGVGKTVFAKGIGAGLNIKRVMRAIKGCTTLMYTESAIYRSLTR